MARPKTYRRRLLDAEWEFRPLPAEWWREVKKKAEARMARQDQMTLDGCGLAGRTTLDMTRAGPLKTDEWVAAPSMRGIGRRIGKLSAAELEAEEFKRW